MRIRVSSQLSGLFLKVVIPILMTSVYSRAQLSPGDLHQAHADLEGLKNCGKCHDTGNKVTGAKCLGCHDLLSGEIRLKKGLHSNIGYDDCVACHVEHQGRKSDLVWWKGGIENFDHSLAGYVLTGKHKSLDCRKCHVRKNIASKEILNSKSVNPDRTFLGLSQKCIVCHVDEHRGQTSSECLKCHDMNGWKPAPGFDHSRTKFPLTGRHIDVTCEKCHKTISDNLSPDNPDFIKFAGLKYAACLDCHKDIHEGKFKQTCETCHTTSGWRNISGKEFDHGKTSYPLEGRHLKVACEKCHPAGKPLTGLKYSRCMDCHADYHRGQFSQREGGGECRECHIVNGFTPAVFGIDSHNKTRYPLLGAHLAIPCTECHPKEETGGNVTMKFKYESTRCADCHKDPHKGSVDKYLPAGGCESCHKVDGWKMAGYDHDKTGFKLSGKHTEIGCLACHKPIQKEPFILEIRFMGLGGQCPDCHQDIHLGQFDENVNLESGIRKMTDCGRCHTTSRWKADNFNHDINTAFKLEGAHSKTPCDSCHKSAMSNGKSYVIYKPLDQKCSSCHKTGTVGQ